MPTSLLTSSTSLWHSCKKMSAFRSWWSVKTISRYTPKCHPFHTKALLKQTMTLSYSKALETQVSLYMQTHIPTEETSADILDELFTTHFTQQFGALLIFWWFLFLMFLVPETSVIMRYLLPLKTPLPCLAVWRGWTRCKFVAESFDLLQTIVRTGLTFPVFVFQGFTE